jgi:hypothetical protein
MEKNMTTSPVNTIWKSKTLKAVSDKTLEEIDTAKLIAALEAYLPVELRNSGKTETWSENCSDNKTKD